MRPIDHKPDELPVPPDATTEDERLATLAVVEHVPEHHAGLVCRIDRAAYPCRLHRWGRRVLAQRGLTGADIARLIALGGSDLAEGGFR
ncbi:MAG TPA: hypothetical protein VGD43_16820 [Micromonospora sp.]